MGDKADRIIAFKCKLFKRRRSVRIIVFFKEDVSTAKAPKISGASAFRVLSGKTLETRARLQSNSISDKRQRMPYAVKLYITFSLLTLSPSSARFGASFLPGLITLVIAAAYAVRLIY